MRAKAAAKPAAPKVNSGALRENVLRQVRDENVRFIRLWFTDLLGNLKSFAITPDELEGALDEGMGFDGSSIHGFARIDESDMIARPDPTTFCLLPQETGSSRAARMFCDVLEPGGAPYAGDPRYALKRAVARAAEKGYTMNVGPEAEYFYFKNAEGTELLDNAGYFDLTAVDVAHDLRSRTVETLQAMGIPVEYSHHEVAPSQHEIDLRYSDALTMADRLMTYRLVVKEVALEAGVYATFMPKPLFGQNGSGMHVHQSLFSGSRNAFYDANDPMYLSKVARGYVAGLLRHAREIIGVCAQWVNSYKRLVPGYEAPVYICWARRNRSTMIRVPMYKPGKETATRIEFRAPDPACNPYLAFAVMLHAGLDGVEKGYTLPDPVERDLYEMSQADRKKMGIASLPGSLDEAIGEMEKSDLVRRALGDHIFEKFIENKRIEWNEYRTQVHGYELKKYLGTL
ncbi:MAG: glutamine synthetase [Planctomycetes bacterium]|nr:glutamine synthetase [Planctomycetota bacterium]